MSLRTLPIAVLRWLAWGAIIGAACGSGAAAFLWLLAAATSTRGAHAQLVFALPVAGLAIGWLDERYGAPIAGGTNLVIDTVHDGGPQLPLRMAPMVVIGTVLTHLFGGSVGREGTAVQMGASLADAFAHRLRVAPALRVQLVAAGIAGGFGAVFGTPVAGAVFALEVVVIGGLRVDAVVPAAAAALVGDVVCRAWGIEHTAFPALAHVALTPRLLGVWVVFAVAIAATTVVFIELTHGLKKLGKRWLPRRPLRMLVGGALVVLGWQLVGSSAYLGLGVPTIVRAFADPDLPGYVFALKLAFTAVTIGAGFLGGEVTPLFFIGASLGSVLARLLGVPIALGAGVGMAAAFAAAANAPIALSIMAVELLGVAALPHVAIVCVLAFVLTGHRGIYPAQRLAISKRGRRLVPPVRLRDL